MRVEEREDTHTHTHTHSLSHTQHSKRAQVGGRGRECMRERCTRWVSRAEKRGSACFTRQPPSWVYRIRLEASRDSGREARGAERERKRERDGDRGRWAGVGVWVGESSAHMFFSSFFLLVQVALDMSWFKRQGAVAGTRAQDTRRRPNHRHKLITRQTH